MQHTRKMLKSITSMKSNTKISVSIIIVNYNVIKELVACIQSIISSNPKVSYEIIVVDNDEIKAMQRDLKKKFPQVIYLPNTNKGFGQANNVGATVAKGEYLFFLNPDTTIYPKCIDTLVSYLKKNRDVGVVAPLLYDESNRLYPQGARELTPVYAIFTYSIIHTVFPHNPIAREYWMENEWDRKTVKDVGSIPGTAFIVRSEIFKKLGGFDENFFLYFEENDLSKRIRTSGWKIVILPQAKVFHALGASTKKAKNINKIFQRSRYYYLKKHFGFFNAFWAECILRTNKYTIMLIGILGLNVFLSTYKLSELMIFIGDQGWFYLSARDMLMHNAVPLVGIESSRSWLHQGALWTYMLAGALPIGQFNPLSGAYLSIGLGLLAIIFMYKIGSIIFSQRVGILASLLFATSPLIILYTRMPYHTSPIPLCTLLYIFFLYQWIQGKPHYLPLVIFILAVLYNLQIATFLLTVVFLIVVIYGFVTKKEWLMKSFVPKILLLSVAGFIVPMIPMLLYDIGHGYPQTVLFLAWIGYKMTSVFGYSLQQPDIQSTDIKTVIIFLAESYKRLTYAAESFVAFTLAFFSFGFLIMSLRNRLRSKKHHSGEYLLGILVFVSTIGIIATNTASGAYLPILFPTITLVTALFFDKLFTMRAVLAPIIVLILGLITFMNIFTLLQQNYYVANVGNMADRTRIAKEIVTKADGRSYNLVGKGEASQFESFTMNYEYLTWWLGNGPSKTNEQLQFIIEEKPSGITVTKIEK